MKKILPLLFVFILFGCGNDPADVDTPSSSKNDKPEDVSQPQRDRFTELDSLNAILIKDPNNKEAFIARAEYFISKNNLQKAAVDVYNAYYLDSNSSRILALKGQMHFLENKSRKAKSVWERCVKIDPENIECRLSLAKLYLAVNDFKKSLDYTDEAISIDNKNAEAYYLKGLIIRDFYKDSILALQYFQNAVDLKQGYVEALDMMGVMLAARGDTLAKYYYQRVLEVEPNRADIYYKLGVFYMDRNNVNRALESYSKALQLNPRDADSYFNMGYMHLQMREFQQARDFFTKAIQNREKNYKGYYGRGYSFEMLGDVINARRDYRAALEANPVYRPAQEALARVNK